MRDRRERPTDEDLADVLAVATATIRRLRASDDDVDEVTQQTACKLWSKWDQPSVANARGAGPGPWRAFIATTARRTYYDLVRSRRRRLDRHNRWAGGPEVARPARPGTVLASGPTDPEPVEELLVRAALVDELRTFTPRRQVVAYLAIIEQWPVTMIADHLGVTSAAVSKHKAKAIEELRQRFADTAMTEMTE